MSLRQHRRVTVDIQYGDDGPRLRDLSLGGLRAQACISLRLDDVIDIRLPTPEGALVLKGRVVRAQKKQDQELPYEYGLKFEGLDDDTRERLEDFIGSYQDEPSDTPDQGGSARITSTIDGLKDRTSELERQLEDERRTTSELQRKLRETTALEVQVSASPSGGTSRNDDRFITRFDRDGFDQLLALGQPLLKISTGRPESLGDREFEHAYGRLGKSFDFRAACSESNEAHGNEEVAGLLFALYRRQCVDFA